MSVCYWPLNLHFVAWFALVPWLTVLPRLHARQAWLFGTLLGLVFYRIGLAWLCQLSGPLGVAAVVGLVLWMGFSFRVAKLLMDRPSGAAIIWIVPLAFVGQEVLRFAFEGAWIKSSKFSDLDAASSDLMKQTIVLAVERMYRV